MSKTSRTFQLYRFQILPTFPEDQFDLYISSKSDIKSVKDLKEKKNQIFIEALSELKTFHHPRAELTHQLFQHGDFAILKMGANRSLVRITKEFVPEVLDNWPSVHVIINNDPDVQLMAVELELEAFYRTSTVVNVLTNNLNSKLKRYGLVLEILPVFSENEFWHVVASHRGRLTRVEFFMVAPNMANISQNLKLDLKELKKTTNALHTNLSMKAPSGEALSLSRDDQFTESLADYSSKGGGTVHLKVKGLRKLIKTDDSIKSIEIDEVYFTGDNSNDIFKQLMQRFKKELKDD